MMRSTHTMSLSAPQRYGWHPGQRLTSALGMMVVASGLVMSSAALHNTTADPVLRELRQLRDNLTKEYNIYEKNLTACDGGDARACAAAEQQERAEARRAHRMKAWGRANIRRQEVETDTTRDRRERWMFEDLMKGLFNQ